MLFAAELWVPLLCGRMRNRVGWGYSAGGNSTPQVLIGCTSCGR